jgi:dipeptidyl aminopeptidase/acylaminoacyl peptidase
MLRLLLLAALISATSNVTATDKPFDAAAAFGARPSVQSVSVSPDGGSIAFVAPSVGQGASLYTLRLDADPKPRVALTSDGKPFRLDHCEWIANSRLVCTVYGVQKVNLEIVPFTRLVAVDADGSNPKVLSNRQSEYAHGVQLGGGEIIDRLPDQDGIVLIARGYMRDDHTGSNIASNERGLGVDRLDTRTLQRTSVESPRDSAVTYISDGRGNVRIMGLQVVGNSRGQIRGVINFRYRTSDSRDWRALSDFDWTNRTGFLPVAVDPEQNVAFGYKKKDGRLALYKVALDGSLREELVYERPEVDVGGLMQIGRRHRVVGVEYATDRSHALYFDPGIEAIFASVTRALPNQSTLRVTDSSVDETKLLILAGSDNDPGTYYLFDRTAKQIRPLLQVREPLEGATLASVKPIEYPAADGTMIPAYLTLPPGRETAHGLPGIVMPHGGPSARDFWGFDWLAQFFASQGFAVLQPNYRGSSGYGDAWFENNGFRSWPTAIGDVLDAGRWMVAQGMVEQGKLAIVGWSYGGYAALQSAVIDPSVFKAVVAIAPVTDLSDLKEERRHWSDFELIERMIGDGPHVREGSPLANAGRIKVPVLLVHGTLDRNVAYLESERMAAALSAAHVPVELQTFEDLDHQLEDSQARLQMLRKSEAFLHQALGL